MAGERCAELMEDWAVLIVSKGMRLYTDVPAGTVSDGASIPSPLTLIGGDPMQIPRLYAAVWHDAAYGGELKGINMSRAFADAVYRELLIRFWTLPYMRTVSGGMAGGLHALVHNAGVAALNGFARICAWAEWLCVRGFGWRHYRYRKGDKS